MLHAGNFVCTLPLKKIRGTIEYDLQLFVAADIVVSLSICFSVCLYTQW